MTRGDVYRVRLPAGRRSEQRGARLAVIVQADAFLGLSTAIVAPTSRSAAPATFRPQIRIGKTRTRVLVEQMRAVDLDRLGDYRCRLDATEQASVDDALTLILGLR